jgi:hypothetical protein
MDPAESHTDAERPTTGGDITYPIIVTERNGRYCLRISELYLVVWDRDLAAAYAELQRKKEKLVADAWAAGTYDELPRPRTEQRVSDRTRLWIWGGAIAAALLLLSVVAVPVAMTAVRAEHLLAAVQNGEPLWPVAERAIENAADAKNAMDPERQARLVASLHTLALRMKPFVDALSPLVCAPAFGGQPGPS